MLNLVIKSSPRTSNFLAGQNIVPNSPNSTVLALYRMVPLKLFCLKIEDKKLRQIKSYSQKLSR